MLRTFGLFVIITFFSGFSVASESYNDKINFCKGISLEIVEAYTLSEEGEDLEEVFELTKPDLWDDFPDHLKRWWYTHIKQAFNYGRNPDQVFENTFKSCYNRF